MTFQATSLCVQIEGILDPGQRVDVIRRRVAFEEDPAKFCSDWEPEQEKAPPADYSGKKDATRGAGA